MTARPFKTPAFTGRLTGGATVSVGLGVTVGSGVDRVSFGTVVSWSVETFVFARGVGLGFGVGVGLGFGVGVGVLTLTFVFVLTFVLILLPMLKLNASMPRFVGGLVLTL